VVQQLSTPISGLVYLHYCDMIFEEITGMIVCKYCVPMTENCYIDFSQNIDSVVKDWKMSMSLGPKLEK
jgi:hypothetical protein